MLGRTRVSALAKELGISTKDAIEKLIELGEHVKSASSSVEAPAADALRGKCGARLDRVTPTAGRARRSYPRNNPYMDLGRPGVDHLQAADRVPRAERGDQPSRSFAPRPVRPGEHRPELLKPRARRSRREYRDTEPSEFDRYVLDRIIVPGRDEYTWSPRPPWRYFEDEVEEARGITGHWMPLMLHGMDYDEILAWRDCLDPLSIRSFIVDYAGAPDDAIELHAAGVTPHDLRWRAEGHGWGTLPDRLRRAEMTSEEVITEVGYRRAEG